MRITGGQITGGITFSSPEPPTITRWVFSEAGADFHFGVGNWDKQLSSVHSVEADYANSRLILETSWTLATSFYGTDETANAFMSGFNPYSGLPALSNAEALAIFQALPVGSRIDFNNNAEGNTESIQNLTYSGNVSGNILSTYYRVPAISIPVSGLDANSAGRLGGMLVYHPANVYDILAVTGDPDNTSNVGITRWVFGNMACVTPDANFGAGQWDENMQSTFGTNIGADGANSRLILDIRGVTAAYNATANALMSGPMGPYNAPSLSNAEALAIFEALPVGSIIDLSTSYDLSTIQNLTYSGNASVFIFNVTPSVSISALSIPVEGLDPSYYSYPAGAIRVYHPADVYDILAVTGSDITRWAFSQFNSTTQFGLGNWDKFLYSTTSVAADSANSRLILNINSTMSLNDQTSNAFMSGFNTLWNRPALSNAEALAIFEALPVGSRIDFANWPANLSTIQTLTYSGNPSVFIYDNKPSLSIPIQGLDVNTFTPGGMLVHHPGNVYNILAVTGPDTTANVGITRWVFGNRACVNPDVYFGAGNWDKYIPNSASLVLSDVANSRLILDIQSVTAGTPGYPLDEAANAFMSGINLRYFSGGPSIPCLSNAEALAIFEALPVGSRIDFANLSIIQNLTYSGNASVFIFNDIPSLSIPVEGLYVDFSTSGGSMLFYHPGNVYNILAVTGGD